MQFLNYTGAPGSQKTLTMMRKMLKQPARYLFAVPRIELIDEHIEWLTKRARRRGVIVHIEAVHGNQRGQDVSRRIAEACERLSHRLHTILLITHEALRSIDLSPFTKADIPWHARVDEIPDAIASGKFKATAAAQYLAAAYDLISTNTQGWRRAKVKQEAPAPSALMTDTHLRKLVAFDKRARDLQGEGVLVNVGDWRDATLRGREIQWYSVWTPMALKGFASIEIAGANYHTSLCGLASKRLYGDQIECIEENVSAGRQRAQPTVVIRYFTHGHVGSTAWWAQGSGKRHLNSVVRHLKNILDLGYYSGNECVRSYFEGWLDHALEVRPKQAGTNKLIRHTSCAFIYSNKSQAADDSIRIELGFTADEIKRARETEDLIQFVMRGIIRNPKFGGTYIVYLYDRDQAVALDGYLQANGVTSNVRIEGIKEAGILDAQRPVAQNGKKVAPDAGSSTFEEREQARRIADAERKSLKRAEEKAAKMANGSYLPPGRPRRNASSGGLPVAV